MERWQSDGDGAWEVRSLYESRWRNRTEKNNQEWSLHEQKWEDPPVNLQSVQRFWRIIVNDCGKGSMSSKDVSSGNPFVTMGICATIPAMYLS